MRTAFLLTVSCSVQDGGSTQPPHADPSLWMQTPSWMQTPPWVQTCPLDADPPVNRKTDRQV